MADFEVTSPDGKRFVVSAPEGATQEQVLSYAQSQFDASSKKPSAVDKLKGLAGDVGDYYKNVGMGALRGAARIGETLLTPFGGKDERRASIEGFFKENADPNSIAFQGGDIASQVAGTAGVGGVLAKGVRAVPMLANAAPKLATALESGGMTLGGAPASTVAGKAGEMALRTGAGAVTGGAMAGLVDPEQAGTGAVIGGALPGATKVAGAVGSAIRNSLGQVSDDVGRLYQRAKQLGIDIPADRIVNSKPLNATAASLNYVPFSGRAATEEKMFSQMNRALSRTFGQDSDNVTMALRKAADDLGSKFDDVLQKNTVKIDQQFTDELSASLEKAVSELSPNDAKIIENQVSAILNKGSSGAIDGQAAYNIKKTLDRIGNRNSNEAFYARDLKKSLMGALNRSLGPDEAAKFSKVRQQYGNMLELDGLAQNGAEGGISIGRLANLKNINNPELQELADIAAQFLRSRESTHGAMQRVVLGGIGFPAAFSTGTLPVLGAGIGASRGINSLLNSEVLKQGLLGAPMLPKVQGALADPLTRAGIINVSNP
jgi:hypothetical protein